MNERLMRAAPSCFARFITAFEDSNRQQSGKPVRACLYGSRRKAAVKSLTMVSAGTLIHQQPAPIL